MTIVLYNCFICFLLIFFLYLSLFFVFFLTIVLFFLSGKVVSCMIYFIFGKEIFVIYLVFNQLKYYCSFGSGANSFIY